MQNISLKYPFAFYRSLPNPRGWPGTNMMVPASCIIEEKMLKPSERKVESMDSVNHGRAGTRPRTDFQPGAMLIPDFLLQKEIP